MQPEKLIGTVGLLQALQGQGRGDFPSGFAGAKAEPVEQAKKIGVAVALVDAVVHGVSGRHAIHSGA
ncbi:hypothetical protein D3C81_2168500 [compost metagenome]